MATKEKNKLGGLTKCFGMYGECCFVCEQFLEAVPPSQLPFLFSTVYSVRQLPVLPST